MLLHTKVKAGAGQTQTRQTGARQAKVSPRGAESAEAGYILIAVIFMVALVVLSLAIAAPRIAASIQRDRELELVHRGEQYKRAIRLYYKKFGSYPSSIDQLEKTNNIRFLRKRYTDPLTGKDDWKLIHMGQAHVRPLGFFGQQLGVGSPLAGATPIGSGSLSGGSSSSFGGSSFGGSSSTGSSGSSFGGSSFGSSTGTTGNMGMSGGAGAVGGAGGGLYAPTTTDDGTGTGSTNGTGSTGTSTSLGAGSSSSTTLGGSSTSTGAGFGTGTSTTLGGAPVVGVMPPMTKETILRYKLKTNYKDWEFVYDPVEEQTAAGSILGGAGNINGTGNSLNGPGGSGSSGFGSSNSSSGFGSNSGSSFGGSTGTTSGTGTTGITGTTTTPQQPTTPQQ